MNTKRCRKILFYMFCGCAAVLAISNLTAAVSSTMDKPMLEIVEKSSGTYDLVLNEQTKNISTLQIAIAGHVSEDFSLNMPTNGSWLLIGGGKSIEDDRTTFAIGNMTSGGLPFPAGKIATIKATTPLSLVYEGVSPTNMELARSGGYDTLLFGVVISRDLTVKTGDAVKLTPKFIPSNATNLNVTWQSSAPSVVTVDNTGNLRVLENGSANITVTTADGGHTATCVVGTYTPVSAVTVSPKALSLNLGASQQLSASLTPASASNKAVTWSSDNTATATVSENGLVTAHAIGNAKIKVTTNDGSFTDTCDVTVTNNAEPEPDDPTKGFPIRPVKNPNIALMELPDNVFGATPQVKVVPASKPQTLRESTLVSLADGMSFVTSNDLGYDNYGYAIGSIPFIAEATKNINPNGSATASSDILPLPIFTANVPIGGTVGVQFEMEGGYLGALTAESVNVMVMRCDRSGRLFSHAPLPKYYTDQRYTIYSRWDKLVSGNISKYDLYHLTLFIRDGGLFDLDGKTNGSVTAVMSIVTNNSQEPEPVLTPSHGGGSSGGCNSGMGISLLALLPLLLIKKQKGEKN